jgi:small-conductance mechanosensitive channel
MSIVTSFLSKLMQYSTSFPIILIQKTIMAIAIFLMFYVIAKIVYRLTIVLLKRGKTNKHYHILRLIGNVVKVFIIIIGLVCALGTVGVNVSAIVASLGLTGFAISFAFKDFLSNVLSGFIIILYRTYNIHDNIKVLNIQGVVEDINLRYTVITNETGTSLIPNALILNNPVVINDINEKA